MEGEDDEAQVSIEPASGEPAKKSGKHYELVYDGDGKLCGRLSTVFGPSGASLTIGCQSHGCRTMIMAHRIPDAEKVREWSRQGVGVSESEHARTFFSMTGIAPPAPKSKAGPKAKSRG